MRSNALGCKTSQHVPSPRPPFCFLSCPSRAAGQERGQKGCHVSLQAFPSARKNLHNCMAAFPSKHSFLSQGSQVHLQYIYWTGQACIISVLLQHDL